MASSNPDIAHDGMTSGNRPTPQTQGARDCSICYQPMTSEDIKIPRLLTCGHTFCTECIRNIYLVSTDAYSHRRRMMEREILCPHCKTPCVVPDGDVMKLPKNYILLEIISEQPRIKVDPERITCNIHNIVKKSYCFNCQELVCPYCQMSHHQGHNCEITIEAIKVFLTDFKQHEEKLEAYAQQLKSAKDKFQATLYRLKENQREASHHINLRFTAIIEEASKWKNINIRKLDDITKEREDILEQQIESLNNVIDETERKLELAHRITTPQNEEEFFIHHNEVVNDSKVLISKELGLQPLVHEHIEWRVDPINHIIDFLNRIAYVNEDANAGPVKSPPQSIEPISDVSQLQKTVPQMAITQYSSIPISSPHSFPSTYPPSVHAHVIPQVPTSAGGSEPRMLMGPNQTKSYYSSHQLASNRNPTIIPSVESSLRVYSNLQTVGIASHYPASAVHAMKTELSVIQPQYTAGATGGLDTPMSGGSIYDRVGCMPVSDQPHPKRSEETSTI